MTYDFSGYATRVDVKCNDGLTIRQNAFKGDDGKQVPLCWQHGHSDVTNVLGHAVLEHRADGVYAHCSFNDTEHATHARSAVKNGDITSMSIYATDVVKRSQNVMHGVIREVSLVLGGANPEAKIDNVVFAHDGFEESIDDELIIFSGDKFDNLPGVTPTVIAHADTDADAERTLQDVYDEMTDEQKNLVHYVMQKASDDAEDLVDDEDDENDTVEQSASAAEATAETNDTTIHHADSAEEGNSMTHNVFESADTQPKGSVLSHSDIKTIFKDGLAMGSLKEAVEKYTLQHGIENIDLMFPDAKAVTNTPDFIKRQTEWVTTVMSGTRHTPFSRIKTLAADITMEEARAKGFVKGNVKKEEFFKLLKRVTTPQTVYKKQKLDRDDVVDITDFDIVVWLKAEMRLMLEEEIARAILVGDGRSNADEDKIKEEHIRPIAADDELYVTTVYAKIDGLNASGVVDATVLHRKHYKGTGNPTFFTSEDVLSAMLLTKDTQGRRLYADVSALAAAMRVRDIVAVEIFDEHPDLIGIMVNLADYVVGSDKGGNVSLFDDFDIDYNTYKYLIETRLSGALVKPKSAVVIRKVATASTEVSPQEPTYVASTGVVTIPVQTGVKYESPKGTTVTGTVTVAAGSSQEFFAVPNTGYYFATNADDQWTFTRN